MAGEEPLGAVKINFPMWDKMASCPTLQPALTYCEPSFFACSITFCPTARPISNPASMSLRK